jgi:outer membrane lipoprotein-sorting protein
MSDFDDAQLEQWLRSAVGSGPVRFDADAWKMRYAADLANLGSHADGPDDEDNLALPRARRITMTRWTGMAAAILIVALGGIWMFGNGAGSSTVFAKTLQHLQQYNYSFVLEQDVAGGETQNTVQATVAEQGRIRFEHDGGVGRISVVADIRTQQSLILFHRYNAAYLFDAHPTAELELSPLHFILLPGRSVADLWNLRAGDERALGTRIIDGQEVEGFEVTQDTVLGPQTITVWADAATSLPVEVEVEFLPNEDTPESFAGMRMRLRDFDLNVTPDPSLFDMEPPPGYTIANTTGLDELLKDTEAAAAEAESLRDSGTDEDVQASVVPESEAAQQKVIELFQLLEAEQYDAAIDQMCEVDWTASMTFYDEPLVLALSETDVISLTEMDRQQVISRAIKTLDKLRDVARQATEEGGRLLEEGQVSEAEARLLCIADFGRFLYKGGQRMAIVDFFGIAVERLSLRDLSELYLKTGQPTKHEEVIARDAEVKRIFEQKREQYTGSD